MSRKVWRGRTFDQHHQLLLLGESAYSWRQNGKLIHPSPDHAVEWVEREIARFPNGQFMTKLTRGLSGAQWPTKEQREAAWSSAAFANYIDSTVGDGPRQRPTPEMWERAKVSFLPLLNDLKPKNVIVLGKEMWGEMPDPDIWLTDDVQAYSLDDGAYALCLAVNHPSAGLSWPRLAQIIDFAVTREIPGGKTL